MRLVLGPIHYFLAVDWTFVIIMGHCHIDKHVEGLSLPFNNFCRICESEEDIFIHFVYQCFVFMWNRRGVFCSYFQVSVTDISHISMTEIANF